MTPIADMIEEMTARGVAPDIIVLAVRTAELTGKSGGIPVDTAAEKRRAYDRERKAKKRNSGGKSGGIPPDPENALSLTSSPNTQSIKEGKKERLPVRRKSTGIPLPEDWAPSEKHYALASEFNRTHAEVDAKAEEVRLWARANEHRAVARKSNWDAMFSGCLRRDWSTNGHHRPSGDGNSPKRGFGAYALALARAAGENG